MSSFDVACKVLLDQEGSAVVPDDNGRGPSKYGVTFKSYKQFFPNATEEDIRNLTSEQAAAYYRMAWWDLYHIGRIEDQTLATKMLNLTVNMGPGTAIQLLQAAAGVTCDGILGPQTAYVVNAMNPGELMLHLRENARARYRSIAAADPRKQSQLSGWLARLAT